MIVNDVEKHKEFAEIKKLKAQQKAPRYKINVYVFEDTHTPKPGCMMKRCAIQACLYGKFYCHHREVICCDTSDKQNKHCSYIVTYITLLINRQSYNCDNSGIYHHHNERMMKQRYLSNYKRNKNTKSAY